MGLNEVALGITLSIAAFTDWRNHKIYNKLLIPAFCVAILLRTFQEGFSGLTHSLMGAAIGFGLLLLPYLMGGMGAGDVKFLTVIGAFGGVSFVVISFLYGAVIGGIISAFILARRKVLWTSIKSLLLFGSILQKSERMDSPMSNARHDKFPYGIAIALGTLLAMLFPFGGG